MKRIKKFEAFVLPNRNISDVIKSCFQDMLDDLGENISKFNINLCSTRIDIDVYINQQLKKSEIQEFCEEYLLPGIGRVGDEGFDLKPMKSPYGFFNRMIGLKDESYEMYYKGIYISINGSSTRFFLIFKNELKYNNFNI